MKLKQSDDGIAASEGRMAENTAHRNNIMTSCWMKAWSWQSREILLTGIEKQQKEECHRKWMLKLGQWIPLALTTYRSTIHKKTGKMCMWC